MIKINIRIANTLSKQFNSEKSMWWIYAYKNHQRIGSVAIHEDGFFHDLYVNPHYRNKYVATRLLEKCENLANKNLYFYHQTDTPFIFYKKIGFKKINKKLVKKITP